jgi:group II intron reverse transcriptase/maturase
VNAKANNTIDKVRKLQRKLYLSAKVSKKRRFHALYDKIYRKDILIKAWEQVKRNNGVGGIDKISIDNIKAYGEEKFLKEIEEELKENKYQPKPVKRVYIPKKDGSKRPLGIPIIKDRIIQMAAKIVIEPIFEADFKEYSYGFRVKRSAHDAIEMIKKECDKCGWWVLDADIKNYFGNIKHDKLMILLKQRISDRRILKLIAKWLKCGVMENGKYSATAIGSPQGGTISPLLSNIYLNYFDTVWEKYYSHLGVLVKYADDFVIISKSRKDINHAYKGVIQIFNRLELQLHPVKTRIINLWGGKEGFDFLGFHHRHTIKTSKNNKQYHSLIQIPTNKAMQSMKTKIKATISSRTTLQRDIKEMVEVLNRKLVGFKNYYALSYSAKQQLKKIDWYVTLRFTIWYRNKRQLKQRCRYTGELMLKLKQLGIVHLSY